MSCHSVVYSTHSSLLSSFCPFISFCASFEFIAPIILFVICTTNSILRSSLLTNLLYLFFSSPPSLHLSLHHPFSIASPSISSFFPYIISSWPSLNYLYIHFISSPASNESPGVHTKVEERLRIGFVRVKASSIHFILLLLL
jgi:hypothetical protein